MADYKIGDKVIDEDGCPGIVGIMYQDGDFCTIENDAAHPNPVKVVEMLRKAGCKCKIPLLGERPNIGPRCRNCGVIASVFGDMRKGEIIHEQPESTK